MSTTPPLLLFDLGGVLIELAIFDRLRELLPEATNTDALKNRWLASTAVRAFELGELSPDEFAERFLAEWRIDLSPDGFIDEFLGWAKAFYPGARELLRSLRERHRVACLSNCNVLHWEKFGGFSEDFDIPMSSHRLGAIKPDDDAFLLALATCDAAPASVWFFDDSAANVETARRLGLNAFHVDGFPPLIEALRAEGFIA